MASEIIISGQQGFLNGLRTNKEKGSIAARNIVTKGALIIASTVKEEFRSTPAGSRRVSRTGHVYWAGAPYYPAQPPNPTTRSGHLKASVRPTGAAFMVAPGTWQSTTGPHINYGGYVDYGTSRSRKFPYMELGVKDSEDRIAALAEAEWAEARV